MIIECVSRHRVTWIIAWLLAAFFVTTTHAQLGKPLDNHHEQRQRALNENTTGEGDLYVQQQIRLKSLSLLNELMHEESRRTTTRIGQLRQYLQEHKQLKEYETAASTMILPGSQFEINYNDAVQTTINYIQSSAEDVAKAIELASVLTESQLQADLRAYDAVNPPLWQQMRREQKEAARMQRFLINKNEWENYMNWAKTHFAMVPIKQTDQEMNANTEPMGEMEREEMRVSLARDRHIEQERQERLESLRGQLARVQDRKVKLLSQQRPNPNPIAAQNAAPETNLQNNMGTFWNDQFEDIPTSNSRPMPYMPISQRSHISSSAPQAASPMSEHENDQENQPSPQEPYNPTAPEPSNAPQ